MAAPIDDIVNVIIDRQTTAITVAGFGLPMFLGLHKGFTERYREYGSTSEVAADFSTLSDEYKAAQAYFGQEISINSIAIGRQNSTIVTYTPVVAGSTSYTVTLNGTLFSFVSGVSATASTIVTGLIAAINGGSEPVTASGTTTLILTADVSGVAFSTKASTNLTPVYTTTESLTDALTAVQLESDDWYGINCYSHVKADQLEVAAFSESNKKLYGTSSTDANIVNQTLLADTTSIAKALYDIGYNRTFLFYSADAAKFPECAMFGGELARAAGAATWKFKQLGTISVDALTKNQRSNATDKKCNIYIRRAGVSMTEEGTVSSGEFIDVIRDSDYFKSQLQVVTFSRLVNLPKIRFTNPDLAIIENELRAETQRAVDSGILADVPAPIIIIPRAENIPTNSKAQRILPDITITATLAGAVHFVDPITVTLTL